MNSIAYKLAFTCYIATLFNANPLLELDGYYTFWSIGCACPICAAARWSLCAGRSGKMQIEN